MNERDFYIEKREQKPARYTCPYCGLSGEYQVNWLVREKRSQLPRGAGEEDRKRFAKARSYMIRVDEMVVCSNLRCRKRFEIPSQQSVVHY